MQSLRQIDQPVIDICINGERVSQSSSDILCLDESGRAHPIQDDFSFSESDITKLIDRENGFAAVVAGPNQAVMAADRIRTFPLYYAALGPRLLISDDARWIRSHILQPTLSAAAATEFYQAGFVAGPKNLYGELATVQAGETVHGTYGMDGWHFARKHYFIYFPESVTAESSEKLQEELDHILKNIFVKLLTRHQGRTMVVPLSGGFDSRLVISWLKRLKYPKVSCYTFGTPQNKDCIKAAEVASHLGYPIAFIHLTRRLWRRAYLSRAYTDFKRRYSGYTTVMSSQEFPAIYYISRHNLLPKDAVLLPGHTGDFISGGHIPRNIYTMAQNKDAAVDYIFKKHFMLWKTISYPHRKKDKKRIIRTIQTQLEPFEFCSCEDVAAGIEFYDWQERQGKFIIQFTNVYKFFSYDFELPLWSRHLMNFFLKIPLNLKLESTLYRNYLTNYDPCGLFTDTQGPVEVDDRRNGVIHEKLKKLKRILYHDGLYKQFALYFTDDLNFYTPFHYARLVASLGMVRNPNAFFVQDYLDELKAGWL